MVGSMPPDLNCLLFVAQCFCNVRAHGATYVDVPASQVHARTAQQPR